LYVKRYWAGTPSLETLLPELDRNEHDKANANSNNAVDNSTILRILMRLTFFIIYLPQAILCYLFFTFETGQSQQDQPA
jgi:hypothetical protein